MAAFAVAGLLRLLQRRAFVVARRDVHGTLTLAGVVQVAGLGCIQAGVAGAACVQTQVALAGGGVYGCKRERNKLRCK